MKALLLLLLLAALSVAAQPQAPELTLTVNEPDRPATGRFAFGRIPELVLIRGLAQTVQLGYLQIDHTNPWPAGDVERASGWFSNRPTRLVDATSGAPVRDRHRDATRSVRAS